MQHIPLPEFEVAVLNKVIPTRTFGEFNELKLKLQQLVEERKDALITSREITANDFPLHKTDTVNSMIQFLVRNQFYGVREGGVYFLTEKGKYLQKQGSLEKYVSWEEGREDKLLKDLHTIEERGYLDEDQTYKKEKHPTSAPTPLADEENKKNFGVYILIIIVIIVLVAIGKSHKWW